MFSQIIERQHAWAFTEPSGIEDLTRRLIQMRKEDIGYWILDSTILIQVGALVSNLDKNCAFHLELKLWVSTSGYYIFVLLYVLSLFRLLLFLDGLHYLIILGISTDAAKKKHTT